MVLRQGQILAISGVTAKFTNPMEPGQKYLFVADETSWVKVTVTGGAAAAAADNIRFQQGQPPLILENPDRSGTTNAFVHVLADAAGHASLTLIETI